MDTHAEPERLWYAGECHCGGVKFAVMASKQLTIIECNCDICLKSGHRELVVPEERFKLFRGSDLLREYRFANCIADGKHKLSE